VIIPKSIVDDFKTERKNITPPLPSVLRLVPILFYTSVLALVILVSVFLLQLKFANDSIATYKAGLADVAGQMAQLGTERKKVEDRILRATDVQRWVEGSMPVQPLVVSIARSIGKDANLGDLNLQREVESPENMKIGMRVGTTSASQIEKTTDAISKENFRIVQPEQTLTEGEINYQATIVPSRVPTPAATPAPTTP
jgi:hypothetical protein